MSDDNHLSSGATSTSLLERVKVQDQDAWRRLAELYGPLVYHWCRRWGIPSVDSQDVVQEVFRAVATSIGRFQRDRTQGTFRGWLWTIARNEARDCFASRGKRPAAIGGTDLQTTLLHIPEQCPDDDSSPEAANELASLMHRAVESIRPRFPGADLAGVLAHHHRGEAHCGRSPRTRHDPSRRAPGQAPRAPTASGRVRRSDRRGGELTCRFRVARVG